MGTSYSEKLRDPRWQKKRLEVLERDGWKCVLCDRSDMELHVHHLVYFYGRDPWEYSNDTLCVLCKECHEDETEARRESIDSLKETLAVMQFHSEDIDNLVHLLNQLRLSDTGDPKDTLDALMDVVQQASKIGWLGVLEACTEPSSPKPGLTQSSADSMPMGNCSSST